MRVNDNSNRYTAEESGLSPNSNILGKCAAQKNALQL